MSVKKSLFWVSFWVCLSLIFNIVIYFYFGYTVNFDVGKTKAIQYFGGYILEQSLSLDNLFLFLLIFGSFKIPAQYQRRVLTYGIIGAIVLRFIFIFLGVVVVERFHWILYFFGLVLIVSGVKMAKNKEEKEKDYSKSLSMRLVNKFIPVTHELHGEKFFIKKEKILYATPLFAIIFLIEGSDIVFAIDSIPAIFSITTDPFIVYTSNIFAILGLRNLYFVLERIQSAFKYVKYGVAVILIFTGVKLGILIFGIEIPIVTSILIIFAIMLLSIAASVAVKDKKSTL